MKRSVQRAGLVAYGILVRCGIMRLSWTRRIFIAVYSGYKTWIESGPIHRLRDYVASGSMVIDVGANVGFFTLKFADWVTPEGYVIAIEPDRENFEILTEQASTRLDRNVLLYHAAASDVTGTVRLQRNEMHPGDHHIALGPHGIAVAAVTVDDLLAAIPERRLSLIKIDVQGAEMRVLAGAARTLQEKRPALFVEVDDSALKRFGSSALDLVSYMESAGYKMHRLAANGPPQWLSREQLSTELSKRAYLDVLFLPN